MAKIAEYPELASRVRTAKIPLFDPTDPSNPDKFIEVETLLELGSVDGLAAPGVVATEFGNRFNRATLLTVSTTLPAIAGGAALAVGKLLYTFPAGVIIVDAARMALGITQSQGNINADTPDGGLGTVIGSGVQSVLSGVGATSEDIITGQTFNDCLGTVEDFTAIPTAAVPLVIPAASAHTVHFNVADTWAASGDAAAILAGTVILFWRFAG